MVLLFTVATFVAAALVFMVQPMVAKALLPTFGGTPQVWTAAMLFFQAALLTGYAYTHVSTRVLGPRRQAGLHIVAMLVPLVVLPIALRGVEAAQVIAPAIAVLVILGLSVGLPYLVVSSTSPLIQRWFSVTDHRSAADPYFLYAAGNAGSLLGLLSYPFLIEPHFTIVSQGVLWSAGYLLFVVLCGGCAFIVLRSARAVGPDRPAEAAREEGGLTPTNRRRATWVAKAFIPSSLLLGVTTHVQTDIAAVPLLWAIPLSLYLITFIVAFSPKRPIGPTAAARLLPILVVLTIMTFLRVLPIPVWASIAIQEATFFVAALVAHGQLADDRPSPAHLTEFFLLLAVGGAVGGIFNAILAPLVFDQVLEYPLLLALVLLLRPDRRVLQGRAARVARLTDMVVAAAYVLVLVVGVAVVGRTVGGAATWTALVVVGLLAVVSWPRRFALTTGLVLAVIFLSSSGGLFADRTFFGVNRVVDDGEGRHVYLSGATIHGVQRMSADGGREPLSYYHPTGPAGQLFSEFSKREREIINVAVVGLGAGGLAAYNQSFQTFTFFEIDPVVIDIAMDPRLFTFLADAPGTVRVVEGDGRLKVAEVAEGAFDLIVLDAFSSDAVPAHLVTREAFAMYLSKLGPDGVLLANVSNTYLDVRSVIVGAATAHQLNGYARTDGDLTAAPAGDKEISSWVVMSRSPRALAFLDGDQRWQPIEQLGSGRLWTDDFSDILSVIR